MSISSERPRQLVGILQHVLNENEMINQMKQVHHPSLEENVPQKNYQMINKRAGQKVQL